MASVNVNFDLNVANSDDEKMPHEHQMDGLVPWEGWCLNKKKKYLLISMILKSMLMGQSQAMDKMKERTLKSKEN